MFVGKLHEASKIRGDYALLDVLGTPGSEVFRARARDGRYVVLRFWRGDSDFAARAVVNMVEAASGVRHPMIARVEGWEQRPDGTVCIASDYVPGRTLDAWVGDTELPHPALAVDFVRRLALGLQSAHQRGVAHHSLYPGNLVVLEPDTKPRGRIAAKLLDLGVPRVVRSTPKFVAAHFMAPEALAAELQNPEQPIAIDARMNVYSCGCLLHYLCTGQPPYQSDTLERLSALHRGAARPVPSKLNPDVPEVLERAILQALEIDPKRRVASAAGLAAALSYVESRWRGSGVRRKTQPPPPPPAARPVAGGRPRGVEPAGQPPAVPVASASDRELATSALIAAHVGLVPIARARIRRETLEMPRVAPPPPPPASPPPLLRQTVPGPAPALRANALQPPAPPAKPPGPPPPPPRATVRQPVRLLTPQELAERAERTRQSAERLASLPPAPETREHDDDHADLAAALETIVLETLERAATDAEASATSQALSVDSREAREPRAEAEFRVLVTPPPSAAEADSSPELVAEVVDAPAKAKRVPRIAPHQPTLHGMPSILVDQVLFASATAEASASAARASEPGAGVEFEPAAFEIPVPPPLGALGGTPEIRDSLQAIDVPSRRSADSREEDDDVTGVPARARQRRRWMVIGSSAASLGACLTWIGLGSVPTQAPIERASVAQPIPMATPSLILPEDASEPAEAPSGPLPLPAASAAASPPAPPPGAAARVAKRSPIEAPEREERPRSRSERVAPSVIAETPTIYVDPSDSISVSLSDRPAPTPGPMGAESPVHATSPRVVRLGDAWTTPTVVTVVETRRPLTSPTTPVVVQLEPSTAVAPGALRTDRVDVRGSLATSIVRRALDRIRPQLAECYRENPAPLRIPEPSTQVELTIDEVGRVRNPIVRGPNSPALNACLLDASRELVSGPPDTGTVKVSWKMRYGR